MHFEQQEATTAEAEEAPESALLAALGQELNQLRKTVLRQGHAQELFQARVEEAVGRLSGAPQGVGPPEPVQSILHETWSPSWHPSAAPGSLESCTKRSRTAARNIEAAALTSHSLFQGMTLTPGTREDASSAWVSNSPLPALSPARVRQRTMFSAWAGRGVAVDLISTGCSFPLSSTRRSTSQPSRDRQYQRSGGRPRW